MVEVGIGALRQKPEAGLQVRRSDAGVKLATQLGLAHEGFVFSRAIDEGQVRVLGPDEVGLDRVQRVGRLRLLHLGEILAVVRIAAEAGRRVGQRRRPGHLGTGRKGRGGRSGRVEKRVLPDGVCAAAVEALDHGQLLWYPVCSASKALDLIQKISMVKILAGVRTPRANKS